MVEFNLLPWRIMQQQYQAKVIKRNLLVILLFAFSLMGIWHAFLAKHRDAVSLEINKLHDEISRFSKINSQPNRSKQNNQFKQDRKINENFFSEITKDTQTSTCFTKIIRNKNTVDLIGYVHSAAELTDFLKKWTGTSLFSQMQLTHLAFEPEFHRMKFQIHALLLI